MNLRRPERARTEGSTGPNRLDDTGTVIQARRAGRPDAVGDLWYTSFNFGKNVKTDKTGRSLGTGEKVVGRNCRSSATSRSQLTASFSGLPIFSSFLVALWQELSFKRDELADRMRWAIRNDVTLRDAKLTVGEVVEVILIYICMKR